MNYTKKERQEYNESRARTCARLGITKNNYNALRRAGQALHKIYEQNCNGELAEQAYEQVVNPLYSKAEAYAKRIKLYIYFQTDPRGATIYVSRENNMTASNYNSAGTCIY